MRPTKPARHSSDGMDNVHHTRRRTALWAAAQVTAAALVMCGCWYFLSRSVVRTFAEASRSTLSPTTSQSNSISISSSSSSSSSNSTASGSDIPRSFQLVEPVPIEIRTLFSTRTHLARTYEGLPLCQPEVAAAASSLHGSESAGDRDANTIRTNRGNGDEGNRPPGAEHRELPDNNQVPLKPQPPPHHHLVVADAGQRYYLMEDHRHEGGGGDGASFDVYMRGNSYCRTLCSVTYHDSSMVHRLDSSIRNRYRHRWAVGDGGDLPAALLTTKRTGPKQRRHRFRYGTGIPLGFMWNNATYVYNHFSLRLWYRHHPSKDDEDDDSSINYVVKFAVEPMSIRHGGSGRPRTKNKRTVAAKPIASKARASAANTPGGCVSMPRPLTLDDVFEAQVVRWGEHVTFTYDVVWERSDLTDKSSRWDAYLSNGYRSQPENHYLPLMSYKLLVLTMLVSVARFAARNRQRNLAIRGVPLDLKTTGPGDDAPETATDEPKSHSGGDSTNSNADEDTFSPPYRAALYCALVGSGLQLYVAAFLFLAVAASGMASQARPGSLASSALLIFAYTGPIAGFASAQLCALLGKRKLQRQLQQQRRCAILAASMFPGISFLGFVAREVALWANNSATTVPRRRVVTLVAATWLCVHLPLVLLGSRYGTRTPVRWCKTPPPSLNASKAALMLYLPPHLQQIRPPPNGSSTSRSGIVLAGFVPIAIVLNPHKMAMLAFTVCGAFFWGRYQIRQHHRQSLSDVLRETRMSHEGAAANESTRAAAGAGTTVDDVLYVLLAGIFPFLASFVELSYLLPALWTDVYFDSFGSLLTVLVLLGVIVSASAFVLAFRHVCIGRGWCWTAFVGSGGGIALYTFVYSAVWLPRLDAAPLAVTYLLYFGSMLWLSLSAMLALGALGAASCLWMLTRVS